MNVYSEFFFEKLAKISILLFTSASLKNVSWWFYVCGYHVIEGIGKTATEQQQYKEQEQQYSINMNSNITITI